MDFASDNTTGLAPEIRDALLQVDEGQAPSYGADPWSGALEGAFTHLFEHPVTVFPVLTGTAANALALAQLVPPFGAVLCHEEAHVQTDECGAPEFFTAGAKLIGVPGAHGRLTPQALEAAFAPYAAGSFHQVKPAALSLSEASEAGTVYGPEEIASLTAFARAHGLKVHMDGARLANALAHLGCAPADVTWRTGVDVLSFGATKNGAMMAEAVVFFDPALATDFLFRRKRAGQLLSKHRFLAAQLLAYVEDGLWLRLAVQANAMARRLAEGLGALGFPPAHPVEANALFVCLPHDLAAALRAAGAVFLDWPSPALGPEGRRFVTAFSTPAEGIARFLALVRELRP